MTNLLTLSTTRLLTSEPSERLQPGKDAAQLRAKSPTLGRSWSTVQRIARHVRYRPSLSHTTIAATKTNHIGRRH